MVQEKLAQPDVRREARVRRRRETRPEGDRRKRLGQGRTPPVQDVRMQGLRAVTPAAVLRFRERLPAPMAGAEPMGLEPAAGLQPELRGREAALPGVQRRPEAEARWRAEAALAEREARWRAEAPEPGREARQRVGAPGPGREARQQAEASEPGREARQRTEPRLPEREARQQAEAPEREASLRMEPPPGREARQRVAVPEPGREASLRTEPPPLALEPRQQVEPPQDQEPSPLTEPQPVQDPRRPVQPQPAPGAPGSPVMFREPLRQADRVQPRGSALPEEIARALKARRAGRLAPERPETEPTAGLIWMRAAGRRTAKAAAPETEAAAEPAEAAEAGETAGEAASRAQRTAIGAK